MTATEMLERVVAEPKRAVSSRVARQMLYLLGDNEAWSTRPVGDDMAIWSGLRHENEAVRAEFVALFPEQAEALRAAYKQWGLEWLRSCTEAVDQ